MREKGLEWAWRLIKEPRRLGRRYLVDGPEAYLRLRRDSSALAASSPQKAEDLLSPIRRRAGRRTRRGTIT